MRFNVDVVNKKAFARVIGLLVLIISPKSKKVQQDMISIGLAYFVQKRINGFSCLVVGTIFVVDF